METIAFLIFIIVLVSFVVAGANGYFKKGAKKVNRNEIRNQINTKVDNYIETKKIEEEEEEEDEEIEPEKDYTYSTKEKLISNCEKRFYDILVKNFRDYNIVPQVNLASIINKDSLKKHRQTELFRNIDFGIFTKDFKILLLIEINDKSHITDKARQYRDAKVKKILQEADVPLIAFWTNYENNEEYVVQRVKKYLEEWALLWISYWGLNVRTFLIHFWNLRFCYIIKAKYKEVGIWKKF